MQPQASSRPVMDVSAPKGTAPAPVAAQPAAVAAAPARTLTPTPMPTRADNNMAVHQAPASVAPMTRPTDAPSTPAPKPTIKKRAAATTDGKPHAPVALITVTVFVMLVLSALAITVYVTSQSA